MTNASVSTLVDRNLRMVFQSILLAQTIEAKRAAQITLTKSLIFLQGFNPEKRFQNSPQSHLGVGGSGDPSWYISISLRDVKTTIPPQL